MKKQEMEVEYLPIDELQTYAGNAKIHTAEQIEQIKESIRLFGFNDPIGIWKDKTIIEGHARLIAAKELGIEEVPVIRIEDLTEEEFRAYNLVHNQLTMNTGFDSDILDIELGGIFDFDMEMFGFKNDGVQEYFDTENVSETKENEITTTMVELIVAEEDRDRTELLLNKMGYKYEVR